MTDYKQTSVDGIQHQRAYRIMIDNPSPDPEVNPEQAPPSIVFEEEAVVKLGGQIIKQHVGMIRKDVEPTDWPTEFELVNPLDNSPLGATAKYQDLQVLLHSAYLHLAKERDAQLNQEG